MNLRHTLRALYLIIATALVLLGTSSRGVAQEGVKEAGNRSPEVQGHLKSAEDAHRRKDLKAAIDSAHRALELAKKALGVKHPETCRAAMTLVGYQCEKAKKDGDYRKVLNYAEGGRAFAKNIGAIEWERKWARYGLEVAQQEIRTGRLKPNEPAVVRAQVLMVEFEWSQSSDAYHRGDLQGAVEAARRAKGVVVASSMHANHPEAVRVELLLERTLAATALAANRLDEARSHAERTVKVARSSLPEGHPDRIHALVSLASIQFSLAPDAALILCKEAVDHSERNRDANAIMRIEALVIAAGILLGRGAEGEAAATQKLDEVGRSAGPGSPLILATQRYVALYVWTPMFQRAQEAVSHDEGVDTVAGRLRVDLDRSRTALRQAGFEDGWTALGAMWLAQFHWEHREVKATESVLDSLSGTVPNSKDLPAFLRAEYWNLRGLVETERSNYAQAREAFDRTLEICLGANLPAEEALALSNLGLLLLHQGDYPAAREKIEKAAAIYADRPAYRNDRNRPFTLTNLGLACDGGGDRKRAKECFSEALALALATKPTDSHAVYLCRNNLGGHEYRVGRWDEARGQFEEARRIADRSFNTKFHVAAVDVNLGWLALEQGQVKDAEDRFRAAHASFLAERGEEHPRTAEALGYLARVEARNGAVASARDHLEKSADLRQRHVKGLLQTSLSERDRLAVVQELRVHPESSSWPGLLDTYLELAPSLGVPTAGQYARVLAWKGVVARHAPPRVEELEADPGVREIARRRELLMKDLRDTSMSGATGRPGVKGAGALDRAKEDVSDLERELLRRSPRFRKAVDLPDPSPSEVADALPPRSALLDVVVIRGYRPRSSGDAQVKDVLRRYVGFLIRPGSPPIRIDLGDADPIDMEVVALHEALRQGPTKGADPDASAARLATIVRAPLLPHLNEIDLLIVAGDDLMHRLPLGVLPGRRPGTHWVDEMAFSSVTTAQSLVSRRRRAPLDVSGALIVGDVDYGTKTKAAGDGRASFSYPHLPGTATEARKVIGLFKGYFPDAPMDYLDRKAADPTRLRELLPRRRYAHLATHGFFDRRRESTASFGTFDVLSQLDSCLVLAGANAKISDAVLTAEEVGRLDLRGVDLITLSACESGLGHLSAGQGVIGLLGAIDRAGASAVISTLWHVDDEATQTLMFAFYGHLWAGDAKMGPAQALRAAQNDMIQRVVKSGDGSPLDHPHYWAAFVLGGNPAPPR